MNKSQPVLKESALPPPHAKHAFATLFQSIASETRFTWAGGLGSSEKATLSPYDNHLKKRQSSAVQRHLGERERKTQGQQISTTVASPPRQQPQATWTGRNQCKRNPLCEIPTTSTTRHMDLVRLTADGNFEWFQPFLCCGVLVSCSVWAVTRTSTTRRVGPKCHVTKCVVWAWACFEYDNAQGSECLGRVTSVVGVFSIVSFARQTRQADVSLASRAPSGLLCSSEGVHHCVDGAQ